VVTGWSPRLAVLLAAWLVVAWQLRAVLRLLGSFRWWTWALFPLPLLVFDLVFARSLLQTAVRGSVRWRGRVVAVRSREDA
jgi:4,4'-diaponeurosporenoate glycosyltransferase